MKPTAPLLNLPEYRRHWETTRAEEMLTADRALGRSRARWALLGFATVGLAYVPFVFAFHTTSGAYGMVYFWTGIVLANSGPLVVLWLAVKSEE